MPAPAVTAAQCCVDLAFIAPCTGQVRLPAPLLRRTALFLVQVQSWEQCLQECGLLADTYPHFLPVMPLGWERDLRVGVPGRTAAAVAATQLLASVRPPAARFDHSEVVLSRHGLFLTSVPAPCCVQDSYQPAQVGPGLWIVPVWSQPPDPGAVNIRLEPGVPGWAGLLLWWWLHGGSFACLAAC